MPQILKVSDLVKRLKAGETREQIFLDSAGGVKAKLLGPRATVRAVDEANRTIDFVISSEAIDRYDSTLALGGWQLDNYLRNPVVLWGHDDQTPAIGRGPNTRAQGKLLVSSAEFAPREIYPLADTVYQLLKAKFLNAASVGFLPLDFEWSNDEDRPYGIDFKSQDLLEWSVVNIPANPDCLVQARSTGIDTAPLIAWAERLLDQDGMTVVPRDELVALRRAAGAPELFVPRFLTSRARPKPAATRDPADGDAAKWECGAVRGLPVEDDDSWDGAAAEAAIFTACGFDGDKPDTAKARQAFLAVDTSAPEKRGSYKLPFVKIVSGEMKASKTGLHAAASRLPDTDIPQSVKDEAEKVINAYKAKIDAADKGDKSLRASVRAALLFVATGTPIENVVDVIIKLFEPKRRAGRVLSKANEDKLREAHDHCIAACDRLMHVIDQNTADGGAGDPADGTADPGDGPASEDPEQNAVRLESQRQRAKVLKLKGAPARSAAA
jgi:HK97 family phage prohead protease